jgi:hypothetical protein
VFTQNSARPDFLQWTTHGSTMACELRPVRTKELAADSHRSARLRREDAGFHIPQECDVARRMRDGCSRNGPEPTGASPDVQRPRRGGERHRPRDAQQHLGTPHRRHAAPLQHRRRLRAAGRMTRVIELTKVKKKPAEKNPPTGCFYLLISWAQRDLNPRLQPCEGRTLPLSYAPDAEIGLLHRFRAFKLGQRSSRTGFFPGAPGSVRLGAPPPPSDAVPPSQA